MKDKSDYKNISNNFLLKKLYLSDMFIDYKPDLILNRYFKNGIDSYSKVYNIIFIIQVGEIFINLCGEGERRGLEF